MVTSLFHKTSDTKSVISPKNNASDTSKPSASSSLILSLLEPSRIEALKSRDKNLIHYNVRSFLMVFGVRGRNFSMILAPLISLLIWDIMLVLLMDNFPQARGFLVSNNVEVEFGLGLEDLITPLLTPVSFLMVFRLGRAAVRYWDARAAMGKLIEVSRAFISTATAHIVYFKSQNTTCTNNSQQENGNQTEKQESQHYFSDEDLLIDQIARWTCIFPIAVKNFVRPDVRKKHTDKQRDEFRRSEIGSLLSEENANDVIKCLRKDGDKSYATILVLNRLRMLAHRASLLSSESDTQARVLLGPAVYRQLNEQIDTLTGAWGAIERINSTPLPYIYVVHLRTFLLVYLFLWHGEILKVCSVVFYYFFR